MLHHSQNRAKIGRNRSFRRRMVCVPRELLMNLVPIDPEQSNPKLIHDFLCNEISHPCTSIGGVTPLKLQFADGFDVKDPCSRQLFGGR